MNTSACVFPGASLRAFRDTRSRKPEMFDQQEKDHKCGKNANSKSRQIKQHHQSEGNHHHHYQQKLHHSDDTDSLHTNSAVEDIIFSGHRHQFDHDKTSASHSYHHKQNRRHVSLSESSSTSSSESLSSSSSSYSSSSASSSSSSSSSSSPNSSSSKSSSSSSLSSENSSGDRYALKKTPHSQSCTDISGKHRYFDEGDDTAPLIDKRGYLNRHAAKQKKERDNSSQCGNTQGTLKNSHKIIKGSGSDGSFRKTKSMEALSRPKEQDGHGKQDDDDEQEKMKSDARKNLMKEKIKFSAFLNEITRQVLSPMRLTTLGVTDAQRPWSPRQAPVRSSKVDSSTDKLREQRSWSASADSVNSSKYTHTSRRSTRLSQSKSFHHHHSQHFTDSPHQTCHRPRSCTDLTSLKRRCSQAQTPQHHSCSPFYKHYYHHHKDHTSSCHYHDGCNSSSHHHHHRDNHNTSHHLHHRHHHTPAYHLGDPQNPTCHHGDPHYTSHHYKSHHNTSHHYHHRDHNNPTHNNGEHHIATRHHYHGDVHDSAHHHHHAHAHHNHHVGYHGHAHHHGAHHNPVHHPEGHHTPSNHHGDDPNSGHHHHSNFPNTECPSTPHHHGHHSLFNDRGDHHSPSHLCHHRDHHNPKHGYHHGDHPDLQHHSFGHHHHHGDHHIQDFYFHHGNQNSPDRPFHHGDLHSPGHQHNHDDHLTESHKHHHGHPHSLDDHHHCGDLHSPGHQHNHDDHLTESHKHHHGEPHSLDDHHHCGDCHSPGHQHNHDDHLTESHKHHHGDHQSPDHQHRHGDQHSESHQHHHGDHDSPDHQYHHENQHNPSHQQHPGDHHSSGQQHLHGDHQSELLQQHYEEKYSEHHEHHHGDHHSETLQHHHGDHHSPGHQHHCEDHHSESLQHHHGDHHSPGHQHHHGEHHSESLQHLHGDHHSTGHDHHHEEQYSESHHHENHYNRSHHHGHHAEPQLNEPQSKTNHNDHDGHADHQTHLKRHSAGSPPSRRKAELLRNSSSPSNQDEEQTSFTGSPLHKEKACELGTIMTLQEQNEGLHQSLLKTAVKMECLGEEFMSSQKLLEAELHGTRMDLSSLTEKLQSLHDNTSSTQQTNNLLEQKLQSVVQSMEEERERLNRRIVVLTQQLADAKFANSVEIVNVTPVLHKTDHYFKLDDTIHQVIHPITPPPAQFMDSHNYEKAKTAVQEQTLGSVPEEEESDWSEMGEETPRFVLTGSNKGQAWRLQEIDVDKDSESGGEEMVRQPSPYPRRIPHLQFTIHNEIVPAPQTNARSSGHTNRSDGMTGEGKYMIPTSPNLGSAILIRSASLEEIPLARHHMQKELRGTEAMMDLHYSGTEASEDLDNEIIHHWRTSSDRKRAIGRPVGSRTSEVDSSLANLQSAGQILNRLICEHQSSEGKGQGKAEVHGWTGGIPDEVLKGERTQL